MLLNKTHASKGLNYTKQAGSHRGKPRLKGRERDFVILQSDGTHRVEANNVVARGSVLDVEEEEDVYQSHDGVEGPPAPGARADVWLLGDQPEGGCEPVEA